MSEVKLKSGLRLFRRSIVLNMQGPIGKKLKDMADEISDWTPATFKKSTPFKGYIGSKVTATEKRLDGEVYTTFPNPIALWVAEFGRTPIYLRTGIPIKKTPEEAAELLSRLRSARADWISRYDVPDYMENAPFIVRGGKTIWNPLSGDAERLLSEEHTIIRKSVEGIAPTHFITNLAKRHITELLKLLKKDAIETAKLAYEYGEER